MSDFERFHGYMMGEHAISETDGKGDSVVDRLVYQAANALEQVELAFVADCRTVAVDVLAAVRRESPDLAGDRLRDKVNEWIGGRFSQRYYATHELRIVRAVLCDEIEGYLEDAGYESPRTVDDIDAVNMYGAHRAEGFAEEWLAQPAIVPAASKPKARKPAASKAKPKG